jgi:hypothetical protein
MLAFAALAEVGLAAEPDESTAPVSFAVSFSNVNAGLIKYSLLWTTDGGGDLTATFQIPTGHLQQIVFGGGYGGYSATLEDADGVDLFAGLGDSLSTDEAVVPVVSSLRPMLNDGTLGSPPGTVTLTISSVEGGDSGRIDIILGP